jgi:hypothetical protein
MAERKCRVEDLVLVYLLFDRCVANGNAYQCLCRTGYAGARCEELIGRDFSNIKSFSSSFIQV